METLEEKVPIAVKVPDDDQGGIGRRLRDRDLLRKRKAEAEARATNQWAYEAQSSKRAKRETNNVQRKKGRPRKNVAVKEQQPETTEVQEASEIKTPRQAEEMVTAPHSAPISTQDSASIPAQVSAPALDLPQIPAAVSAPIPLPDVTPEMKPSSEALLQEVLIEDFGSDEEEDKEVPQDKLVITQGFKAQMFSSVVGLDIFSQISVSVKKREIEEPSAIDVGEQNKVFSDTVLASPQPDTLPGNLI